MSNPAKFSNKAININYTEKEIYKAAVKDYVKIKVITGLSLEK